MGHAADEFLHLMKMTVPQQGGDSSPFVYGHIANYDPKTHRVRVVLASVRNEDDVPALSGWMTLGGMGGNGWGLQIAPKGGASVENPTAGELVVVQWLESNVGVQAVACMVWNQINVPPFTDLAPGEVGIKSAAGASMRFDKNNNITIANGQNLTINMQGTAQINSTGNLTVESSGTCTLSATGNLTLSTAAALAINAVSAAISNGGTIHKLVMDTFTALFNGHTHSLSVGNTGPPTPQMTDADLTSIFEAQ